MKTGVGVIRGIAGDLTRVLGENPVQVGAHRNDNFYEGTTLIWSFAGLDCGVTVPFNDDIEDLVRVNAREVRGVTLRISGGRSGSDGYPLADLRRDGFEGREGHFLVMQSPRDRTPEHELALIPEDRLYELLASLEKEGRAVFFHKSTKCLFCFT